MKGYAFVETGTVKWFSNAKGYGFITRESGEDFFVHFKSIIGDGYKNLKQGKPSSLKLSKVQKGSKQLTSLRCDTSVFGFPQ